MMSPPGMEDDVAPKQTATKIAPTNGAGQVHPRHRKRANAGSTRQANGHATRKQLAGVGAFKMTWDGGGVSQTAPESL